MEPDLGEELGTDFSLTSSMWSDDDLPLTYQYGLRASSGQIMWLQSRTESAYMTTQLPAGSEANFNILKCVVYIYDGLDAYSSDSYPVEVTPIPFADASLKVMERLGDASSSSNDEIKQTNALAITILNNVNCTLAPNCTELYRLPCSTTAHSCGECLYERENGDYFIGEDGDGNSPCYLVDISEFTEAPTYAPTFSPTAVPSFGSTMNITANSSATPARRRRLLTPSLGLRGWTGGAVQANDLLSVCFDTSDCPIWHSCT